jgi:hypothetical protein
VLSWLQCFLEPVHGRIARLADQGRSAGPANLAKLLVRAAGDAWTAARVSPEEPRSPIPRPWLAPPPGDESLRAVWVCPAAFAPAVVKTIRAGVSLNLGVPSGGVHAFGAIYSRLLGGKRSLRGYLRVGGEVAALGVLSPSIEAAAPPWEEYCRAFA